MIRCTLGLTLAGTLALAACGDGGAKPTVSAQPEKPATQAATPPGPSTTVAASPQPFASAGEGVHEGTIRGVISDSMCGKDHGRMGDDGKDPAACTKKCVAAGAKYVLVDDDGAVYALSDQKKPEAFAGKPVVVEGHIDPKAKAIHVHSLKAL
ncbi:MAG: hypothetical protein HY908_05100 [Myxococcales bacterium]|nr:hypothetical protein [Myxococcales bacterium]